MAPNIPFVIRAWLTGEQVDDRVASLLTEGKAIDLDYNDGANTLTVTGHTNQIIYNSSGGVGMLRFNSWSAVITYLALVGSDCDIIIEQNETIPSGSYDLKRARFVGNNGLEYTSGGWTVTFGDNTTITAWETPSVRFCRLLSTSTTGNIFTSSAPFSVNITAVAHVHSTTIPFFKFTGSGQCIMALETNARFTKLGGGVENVDVTSAAYTCQLIVSRGTGSSVEANTLKSTNAVIFVDVLGSAAQDPTTYPLTNTGIAGGSVFVAANQVYGTTINHTPSSTKTSTFTASRTSEVYPCNATSGAITANLPAATGSGLQLTFIKTDSSGNAVTVDGSGSETINGATTYALAAQYDTVTIIDVASGVWYKV